ncbi:HNH endonuclease [Candidatus Pacearchaeota archaeon]|nr:HNH endonuclease [Candidatus Pacearchaeota archaeon]
MRKRSKTLKIKALKRDNFVCQKCGFEDKTGAKLEAHHIIPLYLMGKDELNNLITLCFDCHHYSPDKPEDFKEYMGEETEGTLTTLIKAWKLVRKEHPELFEEDSFSKIKDKTKIF